MNQGTPHIVLAGGGTAGHVNPLLAVAGAIRDIEPTAQVTVIGTAVGLEKDLVPEAGYELDTIEKCRSRVALTCTCCASRQNGSEKPPRCAPFLKRGMRMSWPDSAGMLPPPSTPPHTRWAFRLPSMSRMRVPAWPINWALVGRFHRYRVRGHRSQTACRSDVERVGLQLRPAIAP